LIKLAFHKHLLEIGGIHGLSCPSAWPQLDPRSPHEWDNPLDILQVRENRAIQQS